MRKLGIFGLRIMCTDAENATTAREYAYTAQMGYYDTAKTYASRSMRRWLGVDQFMRKINMAQTQLEMRELGAETSQLLHA